MRYLNSLLRPRTRRAPLRGSLLGCGPYLPWLMALGLVVSGCDDADEGPKTDLGAAEDDMGGEPSDDGQGNGQGNDGQGNDGQGQQEPEAGTMDAPEPEAGTMDGMPQAGSDTGEQQPTVDAGEDQQIAPGDDAVLMGEVSDADTIMWTQISGPADSMIEDPTAATTSVTASTEGRYEFSLTATNDNGSASDNVVLQVGASTGPTPAELTSLRLVLVGANDDDDQAIRDLLQLRKHEVEVVAPSTDASTVLDEHDVVLISASISSSDLHQSWRTTTLPVVIWEAFSYKDLGLIAGEPTIIGSDDDAAGPYVELLDPMHPLSAGLTGTIKLSTAGFNLAAEPGDAALRLGNIRGSENGDALGLGFFAYESGAEMPGGTAPARRVALPLGLNLAAALTADGKSVVEAAVLWAAGATYTKLTRVLPLGDSITRGFGTDSYRAPLAASLDEHGCQYDFVGTLNRVRNNEPHAATFDWDHEGHGGYTTEMILMELSTFLEGHVPDIVLVQLGTNDLLQDVDGDLSEENLGDIIEALRTENPAVAVLLAKIIPGTDPRLSEVAAYNERVQKVADAKNEAAAPVVVVDLATGFDTASLLNADGIHPTAEGDSLLSGIWYDALAPYLPCTSR